MIDTTDGQKLAENEASEEPVVIEPLPLIETPFAQDADFDDFKNVSEFWVKAKKATKNLDQEENSQKEEDSASDYGDEDDSDEDDAEELLREYEKLKREREEEKRLKELAKMEEIKRRKQEEVLHGNPLLNAQLDNSFASESGMAASGGYAMKRKWYEETVFRHYARNEPEDKKRFVNDTVRRDFHRRFLARTIQ